MTHALITVAKPDGRTAWPDGLDFYTQQLPRGEGLRQIAESCWLIDIDTDLLALANIVTLAHKAKLPVHAIFFDRKPDLVSLVPKT